MPTTLIRQIPDDYAEATGLSKYNRSRMPGCRDRFMAALNNDGTFVTGLDDNTRKTLENTTGFKDLSSTSKFWETYEVIIYSDRPKMFDSSKPADVIALKLLLANGYVAPSQKDASEPQYRDAQYYAYTEEGEAMEEVTVRKRRDRAVSELLEISESKEKLLLYGQYLEGLKYHPKLSPDALYKMLRAYIEDKNILNTDYFLGAIKKTPEELQQKILVDRAFKQRLISKTSLGGKKFVYQYGQVTLGSSVDEVYKNLALADFAPELKSIMTELENK